MKKQTACMLATLSFCTCIVMAAKALHSQGAKHGKAAPALKQQDDGQKVFEQNCSRCHNAPEGFSPRISGTIVRHMRVRANLSREDERALLRFFNP